MIPTLVEIEGVGVEGSKKQLIQTWKLWVSQNKTPSNQDVKQRSVELIFTRCHISLEVAFKGLNVILGLYKCNYSLTRGKELSTATGRNKVPGRIK